MNLIERRALARAQKQLGSALESGEAVLDFDIGTTSDGVPVQCIATTHALYVVARGGAATRLPYRTFTSLKGDPTEMTITTSARSEYGFRFKSPRPGFTAAVSERAGQVLRAQAQERRDSGRLFEVRWAPNVGARFTTDDSGQETAKLIGHSGEDATDSMLLEQAWGELEVSRGRTPKLQYEWPRPEWMPEFAWDPPLPTKDQ